MIFIGLIISRPKEKEFQVLFTNGDEGLTEIILEKLKMNVKLLDEKIELLMPMLEIQRYAFFYKIKTIIYSVLAPSDQHNAFFNEITFIKFKAQQIHALLNTRIQVLLNKKMN